MHLLEVKNLTITIDNCQILSDISFSINQDEKVLIIGPNGAGKSTLLKAISGIIPVPCNTVFWFGKSIENWDKKELAKVVCYIPQILEKISFCSVFEFILMARYCHNKSWFYDFSNVDLKIIDEALKITNLEDKAYQDISTLSGGEFQKLLLASAIAQESIVWLLDEPTAYLDYKQYYEFKKILTTVKNKNTNTFIMINHDLNKSFIQANKIIALKKGKIFFISTPNEILNNNILRELYDVEIRSITFDAEKDKKITLFYFS